MNIIKRFAPNGLKNNPNKEMKKIEFITIHCTGNYSKSATAANNAAYQFNGSGGQSTSWHYTVDDKEIYQSFDDYRACWHTGTTKGNECSIGIEICVNDKNNFLKSCDNAAWLVSELLKKHNLTIDKVRQHYDWSKKDCPKELRSGTWGITWANFLESVEVYMIPEIPIVEEPTATIEENETENTLEEPIIKEPNLEIKNLNEPSTWAKNDWEWAKENKITDGTNPQSVITRKQSVSMLRRALKEVCGIE